jgi:hypothetical protein
MRFICKGAKNEMQVPCVPCHLVINANHIGIPKRCPYNLESNWECTDSWEMPQNITVENPLSEDI